MTLLVNGNVINDATLRAGIAEVLDRRARLISTAAQREEAGRLIQEWLSSIGKHEDWYDPILFPERYANVRPGSATEAGPEGDRAGERQVAGLAVPADEEVQ